MFIRVVHTISEGYTGTPMSTYNTFQEKSECSAYKNQTGENYPGFPKLPSAHSLKYFLDHICVNSTLSFVQKSEFMELIMTNLTNRQFS